MKITIEDREIKHQSATILRTMDTGADAVTVTIPWIPGKDPSFDEIIKPRRKPLANFEAEIDGELLVSGKIYIPSPSLDPNNSTITLEGFSHTKDLIDSMAKADQYVDVEKSLLDIASGYCSLFGIEALTENVDQEVNELFSKDQIKTTEKIFSYIQKLAQQRGVLVSSDEFGNLLFLKTTTNKIPVANITEGDLQGSSQFGQNFNAVFDATKQFNTYKATLQGPGTFNEPAVGLAIDKGVASARFLTFSADSSTRGGIQKAADWARNKSLADSLTIPFPVVGFKTPDGDVWRENTIVTVTSPTIFIPNGFDFLIRSVEYISTETEETSVLNLVPPTLYTREPIVLPW